MPELAYESVRMEITLGESPYKAEDFAIFSHNGNNCLFHVSFVLLPFLYCTVPCHIIFIIDANPAFIAVIVPRAIQNGKGSAPFLLYGSKP